jgi:hypothetical protein
MSKKIQIFALTSALLVALSAFDLAAIQNSRDIPASVSIKRSSVADIASALYNATDGLQISQLEFGTVEPGSSAAIDLYLRSPNVTSGTVYVSWQVSGWAPYMNLTATMPRYSITFWSQGDKRAWTLSEDLASTIILTTDPNAPEINTKFVVSFTLYPDAGQVSHSLFST